jgi:hypothetical protein
MTSTWRPPVSDANTLPTDDSAPRVTNESASKAEAASAAVGLPTYQIESGSSDSSEGYARLTVDAPMMLGSRSGAVIGFLRKGTRVKLASPPEGNTVSVAAPLPAVSRYGGLRAFTEVNGNEGPLFVTIETKTAVPPLKSTNLSSAKASGEETRYGLYRELSVTENGPGYAFVRCGKVRVLEHKGSRARVVAEYDTGELYGWIDAPKGDERDAACDWGRQQQLPYGYLPVQTEAEAALAELVQNQAELYWAARKNESVRCERWVFAPGKDASSGWIYLENGPGSSDGATRTERSYGINRNVLTLGGLVYRQQSTAVIAGGKVDYFAVVHAGKDSLEVLEWEPSSAVAEVKLAGYRVSAVRTWYRSRAACESGIVKQTAARSRRDVTQRVD